MAALIVMQIRTFTPDDLQEFAARMQQMGATEAQYVTLDGEPAMEAQVTVSASEALALLEDPLPDPAT